MTSPRLLFLSGSVRTGSFNASLAALAARHAAELGATATLLSLRDYDMPLYDGDLEAAKGAPETARKLAALFGAHHGIFIATAEYNAGMTPLLKNTIDWVSRVKDAPAPGPYKGRVFALGAASPGAMGGYRALMQACQSLELGLGALVIPEMVAVGGAPQAFAEDGSLKDQRAAGMLDACVKRLILEAGRLTGA